VTLNLIWEAKRVFRWVWWLRDSRSPFWATQLARHGVRPSQRTQFPSGQILEILPAGLRLSKALHLDPLLGAFDALNMLAFHDTRLVEHSPWDIIEIDSARYYVFSVDSLVTLAEIYHCGSWEVHLPPGDQAVVIDVGMNVGIAAVFFATTLGCPVYGYEPFKETYERAIANISLNPQLAALIHPENVGVAGTNRTASGNFCTESSTVSGLFPVSCVAGRDLAVLNEPIVLRSAAELVDDVCAIHPKRQVIIKMDCEGSEYEIVDCLIASHRMDRVAAILVEWHRLAGRGQPVQLRDKLLAAGFVVYGTVHRARDTGYFVAFRRRSAMDGREHPTVDVADGLVPT